MIGGWRACDACGATWASCADGPCPLCGEPLQAMEPPLRPVEPGLVVPATVDGAEARRRLLAFTGQVAFPSGGLVSDNTAQRLSLVFLPRWLVDVHARGTFRLEAGFEVEVRGTVETWSLGRWVGHQTSEHRLHWEPRVGRLERDYVALPVRARTEGEDLVGALVDPFPESVPFDPATHVAPILLPDREPDERWPAAFDVLRSRVAEHAAEACGAVTVRALELELEDGPVRWAWELLPVWVTRYRDEEGGQHLLLVHGTTGLAVGPRMASASTAAAHARTASLLAAGLGVTGTLVGLLGLLIWVLQPVSALCLIGALAAGARSLLLPHRVATWNRHQLNPEDP
ncbi:MAG: hypothetical protein KC621_27870 [Myxococcales bacterium]|nr:hypothetical protein [Myxococcales bacterium]